MQVALEKPRVRSPIAANARVGRKEAKLAFKLEVHAGSEQLPRRLEATFAVNRASLPEEFRPHHELHEAMKKECGAWTDEQLGPLDLRESFKRCAGCKLVEYCSRECQKLDWPEHRKVCRQDAESADAA
ncbi:hypothetical protein DFJ74DRAFT_706037 [Hyaloraphidium curvatum]|nr:hypothetical protein DFJ74DRAFT_706037 [Hyaloraphidium curvatum]